MTDPSRPWPCCSLIVTTTTSYTCTHMHKQIQKHKHKQKHKKSPLPALALLLLDSDHHHIITNKHTHLQSTITKTTNKHLQLCTSRYKNTTTPTHNQWIYPSRPWPYCPLLPPLSTSSQTLAHLHKSTNTITDINTNAPMDRPHLALALLLLDVRADDHMM